MGSEIVFSVTEADLGDPLIPTKNDPQLDRLAGIDIFQFKARIADPYEVAGTASYAKPFPKAG